MHEGTTIARNNKLFSAPIHPIEFVPNRRLCKHYASSLSPTRIRTQVSANVACLCTAVIHYVRPVYTVDTKIKDQNKSHYLLSKRYTSFVDCSNFEASPSSF